METEKHPISSKHGLGHDSLNSSIAVDHTVAEELILEQIERIRKKMRPGLVELLEFLNSEKGRKLTFERLAEKFYGLDPSQQKPEVKRHPVTNEELDNRPTIHRAEVSYLRKGLDQYYREAGREDCVDIQIPRRSCTPKFRFRFRPLDKAATRKLQRVSELRTLRTVDGFQIGFACLNEILEKHPEHPVVLGRFGEMLGLRVMHGMAAPKADLELSLRQCNRAVAMAKNLWEAHAALGFTHACRDWDWNKADEAFATAIAIAERQAKSLPGYAAYLMARGRYDELIQDLEQSMSDLCDISPLHHQSLGLAYLLSGNWEEAEQHLRCSTPHYMAHLHLGILCEARGDYEGAVEHVRFAAAQQGCESLMGGWLVLTLGRAGKREEALDRLTNMQQRTEYISRFQLAVAHMGLGDHEKALDFLEASAEEREYHILLISRWPVFRELQKHPRYLALVEKICLGACKSSCGHHALQSEQTDARVA